MISKKEKGNIGELAAVNYLQQNGYIILDKNFRTRYGEIDIIARDKDCTAFVEVKSRKDFKLGLPCEGVNNIKKYRIARMALLYIAKKKLINDNLRFDVIEVILDNSEVKYLGLIKDAFQVDFIL